MKTIGKMILNFEMENKYGLMEVLMKVCLKMGKKTWIQPLCMVRWKRLRGELDQQPDRRTWVDGRVWTSKIIKCMEMGL